MVALGNFRFKNDAPIAWILALFAFCFAGFSGSSYAKKSNCADSDGRCSKWARRGDCQSNPRFMIKYCKESCGECQESVLQGISEAASFQAYYYILLLIVFAGGLLLAAVKVFFSGGVCRCKNKLKGKTVIVTGANRGVGFHTALNLAWRGARVILACRSYKRGLKALKEIRERSKNKNVDFKKLDLSSFKSIKEFAKEIRIDEDRVDILINNACLSPSSAREVTIDGHELTFQSNYLGHFLLTHLLLDKLRKSAPSRIINVSSKAYEYSKDLDFQNLQGEKSYNKFNQYAVSKAALMLFTHELSQKLEGSGVIVNSVIPGPIAAETERTSSLMQWKLLRWLCIPFQSIFMKSLRMAAQTSIHCAVSDELNDLTGKHFADCNVIEIKPIGKDSGVAKKLWEVSEQLTGLA